MKRRLTRCAASSAASAGGNRAVSAAAGASGISTGSKVDSLTNNATCGRQNGTVAYQSPSTVVDRSPTSRSGLPTRVSSFLVAWTTNTAGDILAPGCPLAVV